MRKKKQLEFNELLRKYLIAKGWKETDNSWREYYPNFEYRKETKLINYHIKIYTLDNMSPYNLEYSLFIKVNEIEYGNFNVKKGKVTPLEAFNMVKEMLEE